VEAPNVVSIYDEKLTHFVSKVKTSIFWYCFINSGYCYVYQVLQNGKVVKSVLPEFVDKSIPREFTVLPHKLKIQL
jgi:hypothetical protein